MTAELATPKERFERMSYVLSAGLGKFRLVYEVDGVSMKGMPVYVTKLEAESDIPRLQKLAPVIENLRVEAVDD